MFGPKLIEEVQSKYSGPLRVMQTWGYKYVSTGYWTQSGGIIKDVWQPVFKRFKAQGSRFKNWLILGLATGTIAKMIPQPAQIIGVEIDPAMISIGKKYFDLDKIPNLNIINLDARRYVLDAKQKFDYILVDMYIADNLPQFVYSQKFLSNLRNSSNLIVINHLFYSDKQKTATHALITKLESCAYHIELIRSLTNLLIICS